MAINGFVQYTGGFLPDILLFTQAPIFVWFDGTIILHGSKNIYVHGRHSAVCVCVCVFFPFILDVKFVGCTNRGHTGGKSHRISHPPSYFCGACLYFSREKDSAVPFPRRP